jgi:hypothetical protein
MTSKVAIMPDDLISILDLATDLGRRKQTIFKIVKRLGIEPEKFRGPNSRGAIISYVTEADARRVVGEINSRKAYDSSDEGTSTPEQGVFYLLLLEPTHDPGRFKVGFALSLPERLRALRCSAPLIHVVKAWPCRALWERTAIQCVAQDCERLHTEVFRTTSIEAVAEKCERFFELMPRLPALRGGP